MKNELFICNLNYICTILLIKYDIFLSCFWEINVSYVFVSSCCTNWNICKSNVIFQPCATWRGIQSRVFPGKLMENYLKEKFNHLLLINQLLFKDFSFKRDSSWLQDSSLSFVTVPVSSSGGHIDTDDDEKKEEDFLLQNKLFFSFFFAETLTEKMFSCQTEKKLLKKTHVVKMGFVTFENGMKKFCF